jgi:putative tryptophan/tyrosine transport system substrate-binding protein
MIKRREFITLIGGAVVGWPVAARAQQAGPLRRIGFLFGAIPPDHFGSGRGFTQGMGELGYLEGKDFVVEWRSAEGRYERLPDLAAELVRMNVDVIVTGSSPAVRPASRRPLRFPS